MTKEKKVRNLDAPAVYKMIQEGSAVIIDVREKMEYDAAHIDGAVNIPFSELSIEHHAFPKDLGGKALIFQCATGPRSSMACEKLMANINSEDICHMDGGLQSWTDHSYPIIKSQKFCIPLIGQVQITAGLFMLTAILLGSVVDETLFYLGLIPGVGLIISGATGWCGTMKLLMKMPWNRL
jgi:rhodanese-related sulfurtransferase